MGKKQFKLIFTIVLCAVMSVAAAPASAQEDIDATRPVLDSLEALLRTDLAPEHRLNVLEQISFLHYNVDSTEMYARQELSLARQLHRGLEIANANIYLGWCYYYRDEYERACDYYRESINCYDSLGMTKELAAGYYGLATSLGVLGDDLLADDYYSRALSIYITLRDTAAEAEIYRKKGLTSSNFHLYETADDFFNRALRLDSHRNDSAAIGEDIYMLGVNEFSKYKDFTDLEALDSARCRMLKALDIEERYGSMNRQTVIVQDLMEVFMEIAKRNTGDKRTAALDTSRMYYNRLSEMLENLSVSEEGYYLDLWNANFLMLEGRYREALKVLKEIEKIPNLLWEKEMRMCDLMIVCNRELGDYKSALKYTNLRTMLDKETYKRDFAVKSTQTSANLEFERKMHQRELAAQHQKFLIWAAVFSLILMSILFVVILINYLRKRKLNRELAAQKDEVLRKNNELNQRNEEILAQRDEIVKQRNSIKHTNLAITASISYAKHIQDAAVTTREAMNSIFGDCLVYWKPMNIVSGDFYWATQRGPYKILVVADCTGHGVPGAFMSMFGISTLNSLLGFEDQITNAAQVLDLMREKIIAGLHQNAVGDEAIESIDMSLCIINTQKKRIHYAGANRPIAIVRKGELTAYKPDRMPVGQHVLCGRPFTNNIIDYEPGDTVYMYTDGMTDQFGFETADSEIGKFSTKRLHKLLAEIADRPFTIQSAIIDNRLTKWRTQPDGTLAEQIDDQLIVGVKVD